jgi:hypothetical protein
MIFTWKETLDPYNPWHRHLMPRWLRWVTPRPWAFLVLLLLTVIGFGWGAYYAVEEWKQGEGLFVWRIYDALYVGAVFMAFLAAGMGSKARLQVEGSSLFPDSLLTPLPERAYFCAMHGKLLTLAVLGSLPALLLAVWMASSFFWAPVEVIVQMYQSNPAMLPFETAGFRPFAYITSYHQMLRSATPWTPYLFSVLAMVCYVSWVVGYYLHGLILFQTSHHQPGARVHGGAMTLLLMILIMMMFLIRFAILPRMLGFSSYAFGSDLTDSLIVYFIAQEFLFMGFRLLLMYWIWKRILKKGFVHSRRRFFGE